VIATKAHGTKASWTAQDCSPGLLGSGTRGSTPKARNLDMESSGMVIVSIRVCGRMGRNMA
jgi:hypothetical protein